MVNCIVSREEKSFFFSKLKKKHIFFVCLVDVILVAKDQLVIAYWNISVFFIVTEKETADIKGKFTFPKGCLRLWLFVGSSSLFHQIWLWIGEHMSLHTLCAYLTYCSEAGQNNQQGFKSNFLLRVLKLQDLSQGIDNKQTHRALEGIVMQRSWGDCQRKSKRLWVLRKCFDVSNPTFSANLERLQEVGSSLPRWVPPAIRYRSFPEIKWILHLLYQRAPATGWRGSMLIAMLCKFSFGGQACLLITHLWKPPGRQSCYSQIQFGFVLLCPWDFYFTKSFSKSCMPSCYWQDV